MVVAIAITVGAVTWSTAGKGGSSAAVIDADAISSALPAAAAPPTTSELPATLTPTRDEDDIREIAVARLDRMSDAAHKMGLISARQAFEITSVTALRWSDVPKLEPRAGDVGVDSPDASRIVWIVRGNGDFLVTRTPPGHPGPWVGRTGYLTIDDETGTILGMGTP